MGPVPTHVCIGSLCSHFRELYQTTLIAAAANIDIAVDSEAYHERPLPVKGDSLHVEIYVGTFAPTYHKAKPKDRLSQCLARDVDWPCNCCSWHIYPDLLGKVGQAL